MQVRQIDIYIGRHFIWGNPFYIGRDGSREEVVEKYRTARLDEEPWLREELMRLKDKVPLRESESGTSSTCLNAHQPLFNKALKTLESRVKNLKLPDKP